MGWVGRLIADLVFLIIPEEAWKEGGYPSGQDTILWCMYVCRYVYKYEKDLPLRK